MKAAYVNEFGPAENIQIGVLPNPIPKENEVLVQTIATTVNNVDTFVRSGQYKIGASLPFVIGRDLVGKVVENNTADKSFKVGDLVWSSSMGYENRQGATSEFVAVPSNRLFHLPKGVDPIQAVAAFHATTTAVLILVDLLDVTKNQKILIQGGGGSVGEKLVETAEILGLDVTVTVSKNAMEDFKKRKIKCLDYHDTHYTEDYDYIIDTSGRNSLSQNVSLLAEKGTIVLITKPSATEFDAWNFYTSEKRMLGFVLSKATEEKLRFASTFITEQMAQGHYLHNKIDLHPFEDVKKIHEEFDEKIKQKGKIVLTF